MNLKKKWESIFLILIWPHYFLKTALILFFSKVETISCHLPESNIWRYKGTLTNIEDTAQIVKKTSYNIYSEKSYKGGDAIYE